MLRAFVNCAMVLKKRLNFFYFQWKKVNQVRSEYLRSYLNWLHNWQLRSTRCSHTLETGEFCSNTHATLPLRKICRMSLISAGSFSPDSTFKLGWLPNHTYLHRFYSVLSSHHHLFLSTCRFGLKNLHILNGASGSLFWRQLPTVNKLTPSYRLPITDYPSPIVLF